MQRYKIIHRTYYNYFGEVTLGPHTLHLRPREDHELRIESFALHISPSANLLWHRDVEGNSVCLANFDTATSQLRIESDVVIQQFNENPLDFLVAEYAVDYPFVIRPLTTFCCLPIWFCQIRRQSESSISGLPIFSKPVNRFKPTPYCSGWPNTFSKLSHTG